MEVIKCETNSLSDLSGIESEQDDFEFVENEAQIHVSEEAHFIAQYKSYVAISDGYRHKQEIERNLELKSSQLLQQYLNGKLLQFYSNLQKSIEKNHNHEDGEWILAASPSKIDSTLNANLRLLRKGYELFLGNRSNSSDSSLQTQLKEWIHKLEKFDNNLEPISCGFLSGDIVERLEQLPKIKSDSYLVEQHSFDYKMLKKSLNVVKNVVGTTTSEKFALIRSYENGEILCDNSPADGKNSSTKLRTNLFGLLDHLKRWFVHLSQRFSWFLEFKHEKIGYCCEDSTRDRILREIPTLELEFRWLLDEFLSHFKLAFSFCERYGHSDIMYFFYEALVQSCLAKRAIFEQICWTKLPANLENLNEHLQLMEHQASLLEKIIFSDPLKLVEKTANPEEAYCGYVWLKFDLCLQHFRSLFDARLKGFKLPRVNGNPDGNIKKWLDWAGNEELALEKLPLMGNDTETKAELYLFAKAKDNSSKFEDLMLEFDTLQGIGKDYELLVDDLSID